MLRGSVALRGRRFCGHADAADREARKQVKALTATVQKQQAVINCIAKSSGKCVTLKRKSTDRQRRPRPWRRVLLIGATADALQSTWTTLDQANHTTLFGPQQTISDADA